MEGYIITRERERLGLTQAELAVKLNVSQKSISKYERGERRPTFETLVKMAEIFEVSVDYLLGVNDTPHNEETETGVFFFFFDDLLRDVFKTRFKEALGGKGMDIEAFSKHSKIDLQVCKEYLDGERAPSLEDLIDISHTLEVTTDYLLGQSPQLTYYENKILAPFIRLNDDNKDIVIGKAKDLLREQEAREGESVAAESHLKEAK